MRITQRSMHAGIQSNLQGSLNRLQKIQEQLSSGKSIARPSDSPAGTVAALRHRADIRRSEQLSRNADDAQSWLDTADRSITGTISVVNRAKELALQGINGTMGEQALGALAAEVEKLRESAIAIANTQYLGRPIFGGTQNGSSAYALDGTYLGNTGPEAVIERNVAAGVSVQVNVTGPELFGPSGNDMFSVLEGVAQHLRDGDHAALQGDLAALDQVFTRLTERVSAVGARANQVMGMKDRVESSILESQNSLAQVESIDLPATIVKLQMQEVAYQAALGATSRMIQPSLVDFLR